MVFDAIIMEKEDKTKNQREKKKLLFESTYMLAAERTSSCLISPSSRSTPTTAGQNTKLISELSCAVKKRE